MFGPVWSVLYTMMGVSLWLAWRSGAGRTAFLLPFIQLAANALWSWLFFGWRQRALATAEVGVLSLSIAATMVAFGKTYRLPAALLLPYRCWVTFASVLTWTVWRANPGLL